MANLVERYPAPSSRGKLVSLVSSAPGSVFKGIRVAPWYVSMYGNLKQSRAGLCLACGNFFKSQLVSRHLFSMVLWVFTFP